MTAREDCPLLDKEQEVCKATNLFCLTGFNLDSTCIILNNAYKIGETDGVNRCTATVIKILGKGND